VKQILSHSRYYAERVVSNGVPLASLHGTLPGLITPQQAAEILETWGIRDEI